MSSCGQADRMCLGRFPHSSTWQEGQSRSAGTSSRAREANSNPWDGEILLFPPTWALQSSGDSFPAIPGALQQCLLAGMKVHGQYQTELSSISQKFPLLSTDGDKSGKFCPPIQGNEKAEAAEMKCPKCVHKNNFPQVKPAMGSVSQSSGKRGAKPETMSWLPWGTCSVTFVVTPQRFPLLSSKIPTDHPAN